jgi:hypothetical protein
MNPTPEVIQAATDRLRAAFMRYSIAGLRWDYCCNIHEDTRQLIRDELARRRFRMATFMAMGRGEREVGRF